MCLETLVVVAGLLADLEEFIQQIYCFNGVTELLMDVAHLLVALSLLILVLRRARRRQTLLEELQRIVEVVVLLELERYNLVHLDELLGDFTFKLLILNFNCLLQRGLEVRHGLALVEALLLAITQTEPSLGFTAQALLLHADVEALLVEVAGSAPVVKILEHLGYLTIHLQRLIDHAFSVAVLAVDKNVAQLQQALLGLHELLLAALIVAHLLLHLEIDLDGARGTLRMTRNIEEVHVGVEEAALHELDGLGARRNLIL